MRFCVGALAACILALFSSSFAVAENAAPKVAPPQQGTTKRSLTQSDIAAINAMRAHVQKHWIAPANTANPEELVVKIRFSLKPDGMLAAPPRVVTRGATERYFKARDGAVRAIYRAQPFTMLRPVPYELWKQVEVTFDPRTAPRR
jgi:hypothetical protein